MSKTRKIHLYLETNEHGSRAIIVGHRQIKELFAFTKRMNELLHGDRTLRFLATSDGAAPSDELISRQIAGLLRDTGCSSVWYWGDAARAFVRAVLLDPSFSDTLPSEGHLMPSFRDQRGRSWWYSGKQHMGPCDHEICDEVCAEQARYVGAAGSSWRNLCETHFVTVRQNCDVKFNVVEV